MKKKPAQRRRIHPLDKVGIPLEALEAASVPPFPMPEWTPTVFPDLVGKRFIVVGAASNPSVGRQFAQRLLLNRAIVHIVDRDAAALQTTARELSREHGFARRLSAHEADITDERAIERLFAEISSKGQVHGVVNTAAIAGENKALGECSVEEVRRVFSVNELGSFIVIRAALKIMLPHQYGRILTMASVAGLSGNPWQGWYPASKGSVIAMVRSFGRQYVQSGVTINAAAMTTLPTGMVARQCTRRNVQAMKANIPMGCIGQIAPFVETMVPYLLPASYYITGEVIRSAGARFVG